MTRMTYMAAVNTGRNHDKAASVDLIEARRVLRNTIEDATAALANVEREMKARMAFHRAREMNAELPDEVRDVLKIKGMA